MKALEFIRDRLSEPGTMRSLVIVILGVRMGADAASMVDAITSLALVLMGAVSALKPESK
jgi:hypothetical protein